MTWDFCPSIGCGVGFGLRVVVVGGFFGVWVLLGEGIVSEVVVMHL